MADEQKTEIVVGTAVVIGLIGLVALLLAIDSLNLRPQTKVTLYLGHVGGLQTGADVLVAGVPIGRVTGIRMLAKGQIDRPVARGAGIALELSIESRRAFMAPKNGEWFIASRGFFGKRYLEVGPPRGDVVPDGGVTDGDEVRGIDPPQLDRFAAVSLRNVTEVRESARELLPEYRELVAALEETRAQVSEIQSALPAGALFAGRVDLFREGAATYAALQSTGTSRAELAALRARATRELADAQRRLATVRGGLDRLAADFVRMRNQLGSGRVAGFERALAEARDIAAGLEQTLQGGREILAFIEDGRGSLGGFYRDEELADFAKFTNRVIKRTPWEVLSTQRD